MKKLNNFWLGVILTLSILFVVYCFEHADITRGYEATGGEVFMLALPLTIVWLKLRKAEQKIQRLKKIQ